jgi:hypothetical protein
MGIHEETEKFNEARFNPFGAKDPITHAEATEREADRAKIPETIRKTAEVLHAEHEALKVAADEAVRQMFKCAWDHVRNAVKEKGYTLTTLEKDKERNDAARVASQGAANYRYNVVASADKGLTVLNALTILLENFDPEEDDPVSLEGLISTAVSQFHKIKREKL